MSGRCTATRSGVLVVVVALLVVACSGIPTSGPVEQVREKEGAGHSTVRYAPAPPRDGASPQQVVSGWLDAMLAFPPSTGVAEQFLTREAARRWNPTAGTQVYRGPVVSRSGDAQVDPAVAEDGTAVQVSLTTDRVVDLDPAGAVLRGGGRQVQDVTLTKVDGQWRISDAPAGLLVSEKYYTDYYGAFQVFFFDRSGARLVPSVVHLPAGEQLATSLVASLVRGPSGSGPQERTYLPGLGALRPAVPVDGGGVAEVDLGADAGDLSRAVQGRLSAQLVHTLAQVDGVTGVRVVAGTTTLRPTGRDVQPVDAWARYAPSTDPAHPYAVIGAGRRRVVQVIARRTEGVPAAWQVDPADTVDIEVGTRRIATLARDRATYLVRRTNGDDRVEVAVDDPLAARWLPDDVLLLVDRPGRTRVRAVEQGATRMLRTPGLGDLDVTSFAVSPDGARYALTTAGRDGRVYVGEVLRAADDAVRALGTPRPMPWTVGRPRSVAFVDGTRVAFLADTELGQQVFEGWVDGTGFSGGDAGGAPILPDVEPQSLVVDGEQRWSADRRGRLWYLGPASFWTRLGVEEVITLSPGR